MSSVDGRSHFGCARKECFVSRSAKSRLLLFLKLPDRELIPLLPVKSSWDGVHLCV